MELDSIKLYQVALDQCIMLQQQVIELKALYLETKNELDMLKNKDAELSE